MMSSRFTDAWAQKLKSIFGILDRASGGRLEVLRNAFESYNQCRAGEAAASIAYYALFSLFPLLILLISGLSLILEEDSARRQLLTYIEIILPVSQAFIRVSLDRILENSPTFGLVALAGLIWSSSGVFTTLAININRAWSESNVRNFFHARLVAIAMVAGLVGLLFLSLLISTALELLARFRLPIGGEILFYESLLFTLLSNLVPFLARLLMFFGLYLWVPAPRVRFRAAFWGGLFATVLWEIITRGFTLYLASPFARFETLYGSLGTLVILMLWIYLGSSIVLFGAHLTACLTKTLEQRRVPQTAVIPQPGRTTDQLELD
jgi:membrane protein